MLNLNTISILFFSILFFINCVSDKQWITMKDGKMTVNLLPPNGEYVNDTLSCDETEMTNIDYREYLYWVSKVYGENSETLKKALPDSLVAFTFFSELNTDRDSIFKKYFEMRINYLRHPSYDNYPLIGITYQQALDYSKWRSDRVFEMMLIEKKLIQVHTQIDSLNHFTIERYLAGQYFNYAPSKKVPIPRFRLPTIEEWEMIAKMNGGDEWGIDFNRKEVKKHQKEDLTLFLTRDDIINRNDFIKNEKSNFYNLIPYTTPVRNFLQYKNSPCNLIGNVAEMTNTEGIAKGGSWYHTKEESKIKNNINYDKQKAWLGFRNVCIWEIPK